MTSQTPSGTLPGTLQEAEIDPLFAPRAFQGRQDDFLGTPRAVPEPLRDGSGERLAAGSGPRAAQRPPGSHFGAILEPFWNHFWSHFGFPKFLFFQDFGSKMKMVFYNEKYEKNRDPWTSQNPTRAKAQWPLATAFGRWLRKETNLKCSWPLARRIFGETFSEKG